MKKSAIVQTYHVNIHLNSRMMDMRLLMKDYITVIKGGQSLGGGNLGRGREIKLKQNI